MKELIRILVITEVFYPDKSTRTEQLIRLCNFLHKMGYCIYVITSTNKFNYEKCQEFKKSVPWKIYYIFSNFNKKRKIHRAINRYFPYFFSKNYINKGYKITQNVIKKFKPDYILSLSTPVSSHILASKIKKCVPSIPWVSFFSDPYPPSILPKPYYRKELLLGFYRRFLTRKVLKNSDKILLTTPYATKLFEERLKISIKNKTYILSHFPDENLCCFSTELPKELIGIDFSKYLVYLGSIGPERSFPELLLAAKSVNNKYSKIFNGIIIFDKNKNSFFKKMVKKNHVENLIIFCNAVNSDIAHKILLESKCCLVLEGKMEESPFIPSKIVDCVFNNKVVLAITPQKSYLTEFS